MTKDDKRSTVESRLATMIVGVLRENRDKAFDEQYELFSVAGRVRDRVYDLMYRTGLQGKFTMAVKDGVLYIKSKEKPYIRQLEDMVRKLAMHCDNEALYEEAQALVKTI